MLSRDAAYQYHTSRVSRTIKDHLGPPINPHPDDKHHHNHHHQLVMNLVSSRSLLLPRSLRLLPLYRRHLSTTPIAAPDGYTASTDEIARLAANPLKPLTLRDLIRYVPFSSILIRALELMCPSIASDARRSPRKLSSLPPVLQGNSSLSDYVDAL